MNPVITYAGNTNYTKVQIVAKGDGVTSDDSALSDSYNFFYVEKPLDLTGNSENQKFAQYVQDQMIALGGFTNRGLKPRDNLVVLNNTTAKTPLCLVELAFISNENDNKMFDEKFDALALAIVKGTMEYLGDDPATVGTVTVDSDYEFKGEELTINFDVNVGDEVNAKVAFDLISRLGLTSLKADGADVDYSVNAETNAVTAEYAISFTATEAGTYTYTFTYTDSFGDEYTIATVNFIATEILYTLGDLNDDGIVDNLDSVLILKYDAGLSDTL